MTVERYAAATSRETDEGKPIDFSSPETPLEAADQDLPRLLTAKPSLSSRGHSFASTTAGSPISVTTDQADIATPQTLASLEEVYGSSSRTFSLSEDGIQNPGRSNTLLLSSETLLGPASTFFRLRTPQLSPADTSNPINVSPYTTRFRSPSTLSSDAFAAGEYASSRFGTPSLSSDATPPHFAIGGIGSSRRDENASTDDFSPKSAFIRSPESNLSGNLVYKSSPAASETRSSTTSPLGWTRLRFASCSEEVRERKPSSAADLISKYESAQSGTYKEYRKWKESKWGEDALDEVEFEDDDVNLELSIPAVFSSPIIQLPSVGDAFQNIHERIVGYMISVTDLIVNADYYLKHPRDLWQNATSALWMLLPRPPKHIIDSFISVVCESSYSCPDDETTAQPEKFSQALPEQDEVEGNPVNEDADDIAAVGDGLHVETAGASPSETTFMITATQCLKWSVQLFIFSISICVAFGVLVMTRLYDIGVWCSRAFAVFDAADLVSCQYIPWVSSTPTSKHRPHVAGTDEVVKSVTLAHKSKAN